MRTATLGSVLLASCLLAGCASVPPQQRSSAASAQPPPVATAPAPPPVIVQARDGGARPAAAVQPAPLPAAARSLAAQAEQASQRGDHEGAAAYLERALRIAPNHPVLWQNLAVVRYRQHDYDKVEGLALKSNSLAAAAPALRAENWRLIAEVRRQRGDRAGADAALAEHRRLSAVRRGH